MEGRHEIFASFHFKSNKMQVTKKTFQASFFKQLLSENPDHKMLKTFFFLGLFFGMDGKFVIILARIKFAKRILVLKL